MFERQQHAQHQRERERRFQCSWCRQESQTRTHTHTHVYICQIVDMHIHAMQECRFRFIQPFFWKRKTHTHTFMHFNACYWVLVILSRIASIPRSKSRFIKWVWALRQRNVRRNSTPAPNSRRYPATVAKQWVPWICRLQKSHAMKYAVWACFESVEAPVECELIALLCKCNASVSETEAHATVVNFCSFGLRWQQDASLDGGPARCNPFHHTRGAWLKVFCRKLHIVQRKMDACAGYATAGSHEDTWAVERLNSWRAASPVWWFSHNSNFFACN